VSRASGGRVGRLPQPAHPGVGLQPGQRVEHRVEREGGVGCGGGVVEPQLRERIIDRGGIPDPRTPQGYADFIRAEIARYRKLAQERNISLDD